MNARAERDERREQRQARNREILRLAAEQVPQTEIAKRVGVCQSNVSQVCRRYADPGTKQRTRRKFAPCEDAVILADILSVAEIARVFRRRPQSIRTRRKLLREKAS